MVKYFLGIDYGDKKCGLALADAEMRIATAYKIVKTVDLLNEIEKVNERNSINKIILGNFEAGNVFNSKESIDNVAEKIKMHIKIETEFQDEIFSSKMAQENLRQSNKKRSSKEDDAEAARIILQSWLDKNF